MDIPIQTSLITNRTNRSFEKLREIHYLVIHETVSKADARRQLAHINQNDNLQANAHAFIDWQEVLLTLPTDEMAWAVGQPANRFTYDIVLCHAGNRVHFERQWSIATQYAAKWCRDLGREPASFIRSHHEIALDFGGTDHTDPDGYFAQFGKTMNDFRAEVARLLGVPYQQKPAFSDDAAIKVIANLQALHQACGDPDVQKAAHFAAECLRKGMGV